LFNFLVCIYQIETQTEILNPLGRRGFVTKVGVRGGRMAGTPVALQACH